MSLFSSKAKPTAGFKSRPVGLYEGSIIEAVAKESKKGSTYWNFKFAGIHQNGEDKAEIYFSMFPESSSDYCQEQIVALFTCLGLWTDGEATIDTIDDLVNQNLNLVAQFEESTYNGKTRKNLKPKLFLASDYRTAFEISEGALKAEKYMEEILYVTENPIHVEKGADVEAF